MNVFLLTTFSTLAALVAPGRAQKELPELQYNNGSVSSDGIGILSFRIFRRSRSTQDEAFASCESDGYRLFTIPDRQTEDRVRNFMNREGISGIWTAGSYYNGSWVWDRDLPISPTAKWFGGGGIPGVKPNFGAAFRNQRIEYGLSVVSMKAQLPFQCEIYV